MALVIETLAPQMMGYRQQFHTDGDVEWSPYLMFFHPKNYSSPVVNTDSSGFRFSERDSDRYSVATSSDVPSARLLAGNSVAFGIGATSDRATIASRMMTHDTRPEPWLNLGGRAFNSAQELILLTLYRHMLPKIDEIVLFSGFNDPCLARLPHAYIQEHGAFYNCIRFFDILGRARSQRKKKSFFGLFGESKSASSDGPPRAGSFPPDNDDTLDERIQFAADLTLRHLDGWNALAKDMGAKLTFVLQPTSGWVRDGGSQEEQALFAEIATSPRFTTVRQDVLQREVGQRYALLLEAGAQKQGVSFFDISPELGAAARDDQWLFIDHAHLTDEGYDLTARLLVEATRRQLR